MKNLSVFQIILLVAFGALGIVGVLVFAFAVGGGANNSVGRVEIWGTLPSSAFNAALGPARESDPRLSLVVYVQKDPATYESELTDALAVGSGPDLFILRQDFVARNSGKVIPFGADLTTPQFKAVFADVGNQYISNIGILGLPIAVDPLVLYWNRDMLNSGGFAKPPAYWDEVMFMSQKMTTRTDSGSIMKSGVALGEYSNINNAKDILSALILQYGGSITTNDKGGRLVPALSSRDGNPIQATENALQFFSEFSNPSKDYYSWNRSLSESRQAFVADDLALYIGFGSEGAVIQAMNPNLNLAEAPLPQVRDSRTALNVAHVYALSISRSSKNPAGANTVARLVTGPEIAENLSVALGMSPALRDLLAKPSQGADAVHNRETLISRSWTDPDPEKTSDIFRDMIERVSSGSMRLSDSIQRADQELGNILGI